jgi:hypothetical protein
MAIATDIQAAIDEWRRRDLLAAGFTVVEIRWNDLDSGIARLRRKLRLD